MPNSGHNFGTAMTGGAASTGKPGKNKLGGKSQNNSNGLTKLAQALIRSAGTGIYIVQNGKFRYVNSLFRDITGYSERELLGVYSLDLVHPADKETVRKQATESLKGQISLPYEYRFVKKDGKIIWVLERVTSTEYEGRRATVGSFMDITKRKQLEEALKRSEERYRTVLDEIEDAYFEVDLKGNFTFVNDAVCRHLGHSKEELSGMNYRIFVAEEDTKAVYDAFNQVYQTGEPNKGFGYKIIGKDGDIRFAEVSVLPLRNEREEIVGFRGVGRDVTERKQLEQKLADMATHDSLTGLPNRVLLNDHLNVGLAQARRNSTKLSLMLLDLDRFKDVNDTFGHKIGDQLLRAVGKRLVGLLRKSDTVARLAGDEFVVLLPQIAKMEDATKVAQRILEAFRKPFVLDSHRVLITTSIGIALYPEDGEDAETLLKNADTAMYWVKEQGRDNYELYCYNGTKAL